jgi:3-methyladenine DNA glycosylase/8-oxoguanine DNA glycosylase
VVPADEPGGSLGMEAWGPGADLLVTGASDWLGFADRPEGWAPTHPLLAEGRRRHRWLRLGASRSVLDVLLPTIVAQRVASQDAARSWRRLTRAYAEPAPGPADLALPPDPARLGRLGYAGLHRFGIERTRALPLLAACRAAPRLERLGGGPADRLMAGLTQLPRIGTWTATTVARAATGDPDLVVVGDYGLPSFVAWNLAGERVADDARMLELLEPEAPHRARAMQLLLMIGARPPRHGARRRAPAIFSP